mmetsp:Transcript_28173/g.45850  ORF Transcript_28173/g.45850 Transcript_28173/m.45850 type:complete len:105 (+) Transcript_28173:138-452(+)
MSRSCAAGGSEFRSTGIAGAVLFSAVFFVALYGFGRITCVQGGADCDPFYCLFSFPPLGHRQYGGQDELESASALQWLPTPKQVSDDGCSLSSNAAKQQRMISQ